jgi:hypothetical protein
MLAHAAKHRNGNYDKQKLRSQKIDAGFPTIQNIKNSHILLLRQADAYFNKFKGSGNQ